MKYRISANVIRRLPRYIRHLDILAAEGAEKVSSVELGKRMGLTASQIRQDLNCFGGFGQQGYGYHVRQLREGIASVLGMDRRMTAVVVGAGNLGRAIISNFSFRDCGFELAAAFDTAEAIIGTEIAGVRVLPAEELGTFIRAHEVDIAVLTVPQRYAEETAELVAASGVRGIWNFTGMDFDISREDVNVENVHFSDSLLTMGYYLRGRIGE